MDKAIECGAVGCDQLITEIGKDGEYRHAESAGDGGGTLVISMVPLCLRHLAEYDARRADSLSD